MTAAKAGRPWVAAPLAVALLAAGCGENAPPPPADNMSSAPDAATIEEPVEEETGNRHRALSGVSVMRPSVVPPEPPPPPPPEPLAAHVVFATADALDDAACATLDALAEKPEMRNGGAVTVRGHTDSRGNDRENLRVSQARAAAVADYLVAKGIDRDRITTLGVGETRPVAPNAHPDGSDNPEGRARNRRVEIIVAPMPVIDADAPHTPPPIVMAPDHSG